MEFHIDIQYPCKDKVSTVIKSAGKNISMQMRHVKIVTYLLRPDQFSKPSISSSQQARVGESKAIQESLISIQYDK